MTIRPSRWVASGAFLLLVPAAIWLAYAGWDAGLYPNFLVPITFGALLIIGTGTLLALLPVLRRWEERPDDSD